MKTQLKKKSYFQQILKQLNNYRKRFIHWDFDVLNTYVIYKNDVSFVQIGSNNGVNDDPIHNYVKKYKWQGVLVEPVPYLFEELKANYRELSNRLIFENSAIAKESGELKFYRLRKSDLPNLPIWYEGLGSFNKDIVLKHRNKIPHFDNLFMEDTITSITFQELINKYSIRELNLVHIDTEGYDFEIIKLIPFANLNIDLLMFEHKHLSNTDYLKAKILLRKNGYEVRSIDLVDTIAIKKNLLDTLSDISKNTI